MPGREMAAISGMSNYGSLGGCIGVRLDGCG